MYSSYQGTDTLLTRREWEGLALQSWRDSLSITPKHPLRNTYYALAGYRLRGLDLNGHLAGIAAESKSSVKNFILANAIIYVLLQPSSLVERFAEQY